MSINKNVKVNLPIVGDVSQVIKSILKTIKKTDTLIAVVKK